MAKMLESLLSWLDVGSRGASDEQLLIWAKTEYGNDWAYAYQQMRDTGKPPVMKNVE